MIAALIEFLGYLAFAALLVAGLGTVAAYFERRATPPTVDDWLRRHAGSVPDSVPDSGQRERRDA